METKKGSEITYQPDCLMDGKRNALQPEINSGNNHVRNLNLQRVDW
ncbi:MAG: hypothetical protein KA368_02740 [Acidobacteria bacterium]|nr:hypothetical protein [Acidobacteriota bacterium]